MKIAYVTPFDALNRRNWSGTAYYMSKSLVDQSVSIEYIGPLSEYWSTFFKWKELIYLKLLRKRHLRVFEPSIRKGYAEQVAEKLSYTDPDVVLSTGVTPISYLSCSQPVVFWADAAFAGMVDFYPEFSNLSKESINNGNQAEQSALEKCKLAIYSSEWAAKTAIDNYRVDSSKVKVVPFGANIEHNRTLKDTKNAVEARPSDSCKLLFLGVEWQRKGGETALRVAKELNEQGLKTELTVVGCEPHINKPIPDFLRVFRFVSKSTASGRKQLEELIAGSHFLILPTKADCFGIVLCEANSYGVPCLTTDVGGIPTIIKNDANGRVFSIREEPSKYCEYIS
ncbi:MAG: glycosyltransferase family 4 protein, partial [Pseudomonadota bacterium]|nr:glycosyltransferase family 4 protein [Pseudomonadota bacterium]